jgi:hypothetical protein
MNKKLETRLLNITAQYVDEVQAGRQPRLSDYLVRYPRYADAIADFVAYYHAVEEVRPLTGVMPSTDAINLVPTLQAINCHLSCQDEQVEELASPGRITTLLTTATGQRMLPSQLALELDLSRDIILLLEQRAIAPATIPHVLYEQIAMLLQYSSTVVQEYFCSWGQCQSQSVITKRKQQTKVAEENTDYTVPLIEDKISFRSIVETSLQLSAEQRSHWYMILVTEGL